MGLELDKIDGYTLKQTIDIAELGSVGYLLEHNRTKAKIAVMHNEDKNKVFSIGFRTPVMNSTGVAHIVEHTVLCGSNKYPLKDPFVELLKGSLNTFMNAMTFPDKTIYPVASLNDKDFENLMDVYLDAVFNPMIYQREEIFCQEGYCYEFDEQDNLTVNGIVYNEMKGAFSKPEEILSSKLMEALYPDNNYGYESGGDPKNIPDLTYEEYLNFHRKFYHPSNSYLFLYGDMDVVSKLKYIDEEFLSKFDYQIIDSEILDQKPFEKPRYIEKTYPIGDSEDDKNKTFFAYGVTAGSACDKNLYYAMKVLDYALVSNTGAVIKKALIDAGLCTDVLGGEQNLKERYFSIVAKGANSKDRDKFVEVVENTLKETVEKGLSKDSLRAALNIIEFNYREADFGSYPSGIFYLLDSYESFLYDDNEPFMHVKAADTLEYLKEMVDTDYYEKLIEKYFLNNNHKVILTLAPQKGLAKIWDDELREKMEKIKESLSAEEIEVLKEKNRKLEEFHNTPETEENLKKIPLLSIDDIDKKVEELVIKECEFAGEKLLHSNINTNGICYIDVMFNAKYVDEELLPYVGFLKYMLGSVDTKSHEYSELSDYINMNSGGWHNDLSIYVNPESSHDYNIYFDTIIKVFYDRIDTAFDIIKELLLETRYDDKKRIGEIIAEAKGRLESSILGSGHVRAVQRANANFSEPSYFADKMGGIDYYVFLRDAYNTFDENADTFIANLNRAVEQLMTKESMSVHVTCDEVGFDIVNKKLSKFVEEFSEGGLKAKSREFEANFTSEAIIVPSTIQFVARTGEYKSEGLEYTGHLKVLSNILGYGYLWENIRDKGGAYGCMYDANRSGRIHLVSYRDPKLKETNEVYSGLPQFLRTFEASEDEVTKYIIGAIANVDSVKKPKAKGNASLSAYMSKVSDEARQKERDQILGTTLEDIVKLAEHFEAALTDDCICVIGSSEKIEENKDMFTKVWNLFEN